VQDVIFMHHASSKAVPESCKNFEERKLFQANSGSINTQQAQLKLMKLSLFNIATIITGILFITAACSVMNNDDLIQPPDLYKLGEFTDNGLTVEAWADQPLAVGYNNLYFEVHEDGVRFERAHIYLTTMMHMEAHSHASPFDEPGHHRDEMHHLYKAWAIFTMPSGMMGSWELQITVHDEEHSGFEAAGIIEVDVEESNRVKTFMTEDESRYVLTLVEPADPETGLNDLKVALHKRESMRNFPPVLNAGFEFEPWMPSMDHGSGNNVAPVHDNNGFYSGQVNFNMTGDWELRFNITLDGEDLGDHIFELDF
jgi:hypothetical protein